MKNIIQITILLMVFVLNTYATPSKINPQEYAEYDFITILDNGVKRQVKVLKTELQKSKARTSKREALEDKMSIIVSFKDTQNLSLDDFERKYNLELKTKLLIGYHIFYILSSKSDVELTQEIIQNETNIKTVKPN